MSESSGYIPSRSERDDYDWKFKKATLTESEFNIAYQKRFSRLKEFNDSLKFRPPQILSSYLSRVRNNTLWEHRDIDELVEFQKYLKTIDGKSAVSLAIGSSVSVLQFEPHVSSNVIEIRGNQIPKKIKAVFYDDDSNVDWIEFTDGSTFPDKEFINHGKGGGIYDGLSTLFFKDYDSANKALMMAILRGPAGWNISAVNLEESAVVSEASGYIPSERERNDPRYSTALTVDVHPSTMRQQAQAMGLGKIKRAGIPQKSRVDGKFTK